jgi:hypothetical protein
MNATIRTLARTAAVAVLAVLLIVWCESGWWPIPTVSGQIEARMDVAHGHFKELGYGLPFAGADEYARLLRERYGIDFHYVDFCTVSRQMRAYADAYNEVSTIAAKRKFGRDVFREAYDQAVETRSQSAAAKSGN